jgi:hypothetical protein
MTANEGDAMRAVVVYESMYGNTHLVADAIADGLGDRADVTVVPVGAASAALVDGVDLLVVGGPTHAHGMSRESTRNAAVEAAEKPGAELTVEPDAEGPGLRDWFESLGRIGARAAAFDTRFDMPPLVTGRASKGIARQLRDHGCEVIASESFFVEKGNRLLPDEEARARAWGALLGDRQRVS